MMTKEFVNGSNCGFPLFNPLFKTNKQGFWYTTPLKWVLMIKFILSDLKGYNPSSAFLGYELKNWRNAKHHTNF